MSRPLPHHWLNRMAHPLRGSRRCAASPDRHRSRLVVEALEARWVPSTVTNLMDSGPGSLRQALLDTPAGGTVDFQPGLTGTIPLSSPLGIHQDLTIAGPGADAITLSNNGAGFLLGVDAGVNAAVSGLTITGGYVEGTGGGIHNDGTLALTGCVIANNTSVSDGGGILNSGTLYVTGSTIRDNRSVSRGGGGIYGGTVSIVDSTLSGNLSGTVETLRGSITIINSTLSGNYGVFGLTIGPVTLGNTIIAGNVGGFDVGSTMVNSLGYNLIGNGGNQTGYTSTDVVGTADDPIDPLLGPLADNGGPTPTMALLPGSPALDAGDPAQLGVPDQRGVVRSGGVNIGAYQASASAFVLNTPAKVRAGVPFDVTVTAVDPFGQLAAGYTGTVTFSTTDPDAGVVLPADYAFTPADAGVHTFSDTGSGGTTLVTRGYQSIFVTDTADGSITGSAVVKVRHLRHHDDGSPGLPAGQDLAAADQVFAALVLDRRTGPCWVRET